MLTIHANLIHKPTTMRQPVCKIEKIIELPQDEFIALSHHPEADYGFIAENRDLMGQWDGAYHCLLALDKDGTDGVLIEAEGYGSVRYGAYVSHARDFVERELERTAAFFLKDIAPDPETGDIDIYLGDIEVCTGAQVRDDSEIARMFYRILKEHPAVAGVETVGDCIVVTPAAAQEQALVDSLIGWVGNHYDSRELYDILHGELGMSQKDTELLGFDISDHFENKELTQTGGMEMS